MKSAPPLSPYGTFAGSLFQYSTSPSLIAFESLPPINTNSIGSGGNGGNDATMYKNKCILLGGLSDGPIPTPYTKLLEHTCHNLHDATENTDNTENAETTENTQQSNQSNPSNPSSQWSLIQPILSSSYLGFGHSSLSRDTHELNALMHYLICHRGAENLALVGHSTGCQNGIHFLRWGERELVERVKVVALQAPVSDRESLTLSPGDHSVNLEHAKKLLSEEKGEEMMPRSAFWAPITASRYLSLFDKYGDDDFFSSDFTDEELRERLGHVGTIGETSGLKLLAAFSGKDEYVPEHVDKDLLLRRMVRTMNNGKDGASGEDGEGGECAECVECVARGLMLENANHNLSEGEGDGQRFVEAVGELLREASS